MPFPCSVPGLELQTLQSRLHDRQGYIRKLPSVLQRAGDILTPTLWLDLSRGLIHVGGQHENRHPKPKGRINPAGLVMELHKELFDQAVCHIELPRHLGNPVTAVASR